jgi:hypothetical protein
MEVQGTAVDNGADVNAVAAKVGDKAGGLIGGMGSEERLLGDIEAVDAGMLEEDAGGAFASNARSAHGF